MSVKLKDYSTMREAEAYQDWLRRKVEHALADERPPSSHEEVTAYFRTKRARRRS